MTTNGSRLEIDDLSKQFAGIHALKSVSFAVEPGTVVGLIGPNGSGKSTLLSIVRGQIRPTGGTIALNGERIDALPADRISRRGVAGTFQLVRVPDGLSALDNVAVASMYGPGRLSVAKARARAAELLNLVEFDADPQARPADLTYFDQKRIELARALAAEPKLLLLDEWLAGLTPTELRKGIDLVRAVHGRFGLTVIIVEHVMYAVRALCERVVVLSTGEIICDESTEEALADPLVVEVYLGTAHA